MTRAINYIILALFMSINAHAAMTIDINVTGHVVSRPEVLAGTVEIDDQFTVTYSVNTELLPESLSSLFVNEAITKLTILNNDAVYEHTLSSMGVSQIGVGNYDGASNIHFNAAPSSAFPIGDAYLRQVFLSLKNTNIDKTHFRDTFYDSLLNSDYYNFRIGVMLPSGFNANDIILAIDSTSISNYEGSVPNEEEPVTPAPVPTPPLLPVTPNAGTLPATAIGVVSDSNNDNIGDEASTSSSLLISAGLQSSGSVGNNGTVRWQIEWDISTLSSEEINNAIILLKTHKGAVDNLDTFIFHGLDEQDGKITEADFTAQVDVLDIVMPVVDGISSFEFDVTELLRSDLTKGYQFFSLQGRVDETLSTNESYVRGLQIYSNEAILLINQQVPKIAVKNEKIAQLNTGFILTANAKNCEVNPNGWVWVQDPYNLTMDEADGEIIAGSHSGNLTLNWSTPGNKIIRVKNSACGDDFSAETTVVVSGGHCNSSVNNQLLAEPSIIINGIIRDTLDNQPLIDVCVDLGITNTKTAKDGTFSLTVPINRGKVYATLSKPGYIERNAALVIGDSNIDFQSDLIDLNNDFFDLLAYKKVLYDHQLVAPSGLVRLTEQFDFYIDKTPDAITGEMFSQQQIDHITELIPNLVMTMTNGFIENPVITIGVNPPQNNVITFSLDSTISSKGAAGHNHVYLKSPELALNDYTVTHELAHTLGYAHTNGVSSLMTNYSIFYSSLDKEMIGTYHPTNYDVNFAKILYSRNPGSTIAAPADIAIEFDFSLPQYNSSNDIEELLNWAEVQFPQLFSPSGVETQSIELVNHRFSGLWQYRYFSETDTYIGVRNGKSVYVLGGNIWKNITYVGTLQYFLNQIN